MARTSKYVLARRLLNGGYFSQYRDNATKLAKDTSWEDLNTYYREMTDYERNVRGMEYQLL